MSRENGVIELFPNRFSSNPLLKPDLIESLRNGEKVDDLTFDEIFPTYYQFKSAIHWSPIEVAQQIAKWIVPLGKSNFIDIGCGVGKLCLLIRILTNLKIVGIEQRASLVQIAKNIIQLNHLEDITVLKQNMLDLDWDLHDVYYLYNPFQEHVTVDGPHILQNDVTFDKKSYVQYTSEVFRQLSWARSGKVLITFHGYGGSIPSSWRMVASRHIENGDLTMWIKGT